MDEVAYARYMQRAKDADFIYKTIREIYGYEIPWKQAYYKALKDKLLYPEEKKLVKEFHPIK